MNNLLLLHGAIGSVKQFSPLVKILQEDYKVYAIDFAGHGGSEIPDAPFSINMFAEDVLKWMELKEFETIDIFGYSMGGYVGLYLARKYPDRVGRVFTLATKFSWHEETAKMEAGLLNPDKLEEKMPAFAEELAHRHSPADWKLVLRKTADMMIDLGHNNILKDGDFARIENEVLIGVGDRDKMVCLEETIHVYRKLQNGSLIVFPDTPHPFEKVSIQRLSEEIKSFFK